MNNLNILTHAIDHAAWRDDFFPPLHGRRILARAAGMVAVFLMWVVLAVALCIALIQLGVTVEIAALLGLLAPPLLVVALNVAGVFNRPRGDLKNLKAFRRWIAGPAGQRRGLAPEHLAQVSPQGHSALMIEVTPSWLEQPTDKRLADLNHWYVVWDFCRDEHADRSVLALTIRDQAGQAVGGSNADDGGSVWVVESGLPHGLYSPLKTVPSGRRSPAP